MAVVGRWVALALLVGLVFAEAGGPGGTARAQDDPEPEPEPEPVVFLVTTGSDAVVDPECPHASKCSLREAIVSVNAYEGEEPLEIRFSPTSFPKADPVRVELVSQLPAIEADGVLVDGSDAAVIISGNDVLDEDDPLDGLTLDGDGITVLGVTVSDFEGACVIMNGDGVTVGGTADAANGVVLESCGTGIVIEGEGARVVSTHIGLSDEPAVEMATGIVIRGDGAQIGTESEDDEVAAGNVIGNADSAIVVDAEEATIENNLIGQAGDKAAPVGVGIHLTNGADGARIAENTIRNTSGAAIRLAARAANSANTISRNSFATIGGLAIDLGGDGNPNPNDAGDDDTGPNALLNHPVITRATTSQVSGRACAGCEVELYLAAHSAGSVGDHPTIHLGTEEASEAGNFSFSGVPLTAGSWVTATATSGDGATSEFGPTEWVGTGSVTCSATEVRAGWTFAAYYGASVTLDLTFPASGEDAGAVQAIYELVPGTNSFRRWISGTTIGRTLNSLEPGGVYFFLSDASLELGGGFSLGEPYPIELAEGWNAIAYIGGQTDYRDALRSLGDALVTVYRFTPEGRWETVGPAGTPAWARDFRQIQGCGAYLVETDEEATLIPLQP